MGDGPDKKKYKPDEPEVEARKKQERAEHNRKRLEAERRWISGRDFYDRLGVARDANDREIKKAYRTLCALFHPDKVDGDKAKSTGILRELNEAYEALGDPDKRVAYDRGGAEGVRDAERRRQDAEHAEKMREEGARQREERNNDAKFHRWSRDWFDNSRPDSAFGQAMSALRSGKPFNGVKDALEAALEEKLVLIPERERKTWRDMLGRSLETARLRFRDEQDEARRRAGAGAGGAGARAGGDPGRGGDAGERARREYAEKKRTFDAMFDGWTTDANKGSLFEDTLNLLEGGYSFQDATLAAGRDFDSAFNRSGLFVGDRPEYIRRMNETLERARVEYEAKQAGRRGGAGAGAGGARGGDAGGARERAERERVEKERQRQAFERIMENLLGEKSPVGFYTEALKGFRDGRTFRSVKISSEARFETELRDYRSVISNVEQLAYKTKIEEVIKKAERFYQDEREARDQAYREAEAKNLREFTERFDQWMTKTHPDSLFIENWEKLKRGVPLAEVVHSIRQELAEGFLRRKIPASLQEPFKQKVEAAILELQRDFQSEQERERRRREFRGRADKFIKDSPDYVRGELKKVDVSEDITAFVAQLKVLSLEVLNGMIREYPELSSSEVQKYKEDLERSIASTVAEAKRAKPKEKGREAFEAWLGGVEETAYQAMKNGELYGKVLARIKVEAAAKVASAPADKQQKFIDKVEAEVDKAFKRNEKEKKTEYEKWSKTWFANLQNACEVGLGNGVTPDVVRSELRKMLESKVSALPRDEDRKAEIRRMETTVDAVIEQWKKKPGRENATGEKERAEKAAAEAWLSGAEAKQKIYAILKSGMHKEEAEKIARVILRNKMPSLSEADQKPYLDRLATLITVESVRYEQDKKREPSEAEKSRAEFEAWVRPWLSRLAGSCRSLLEGRKFEGGNWVPLNQKYDAERVKRHMQKTLADNLVRIPRGEHAVYVEQVERVVAAAIALDNWKKTLPLLCQPMLAEGRKFSEIRKDINGKLESLLAMISPDQHAAYRKSIGEELSRLEGLYEENEKRKGDMNDFLKSVFGDGKK